MSDRLKPGQPAPRSGQYEQVGPRGGHTGEERTVMDAILRFSREVAFSAARVYARAAESRA